MVLDISGIYFFMPVFSFLFVFLIVYAILSKTEILGESKFINVLVGFIMAIIFMSFSSLELYVITIVPWAAVMLVIVLLVLLLAGLSTKDLGKIMTPTFAWIAVAILIIIFLIAAIRVFNPVFHPDLVITSGRGSGIVSQISDIFSSQVGGTVLLLAIVAIVAFVITKK